MEYLEKNSKLSSAIIQKDVDFVVEELLKGKVVAFPTDTVYGLGCVYDDEVAIQKIKQIKGRDASKPLPMMVAHVSQLEKIALVDENAKKLFDAFSPGAITIILKKHPQLQSFVNNGFETIAIRIPNDVFVLDVLNVLNKPLLVTSANRSNEKTGTTLEEVLAQIWDEIDYIVEGECVSKTSSTIVDCSTDKLKILRVGEISEQEIKEVVKCE